MGGRWVGAGRVTWLQSTTKVMESKVIINRKKYKYIFFGPFLFVGRGLKQGPAIDAFSV